MLTGRSVHRAIGKIKTERIYLSEERLEKKCFQQKGGASGVSSRGAMLAHRPAGFALWNVLRKGLVIPAWQCRQ